MSEILAVDTNCEAITEPAPEDMPDRAMAAVPDTATPRSRRSVMAAAFGGVAALIGHRLAAADPAAAANGEPLLIGQRNDATAHTLLISSALQGLGVQGALTAIDGTTFAANGVGIQAIAGYIGPGKNYGIKAYAGGSEGFGVHGESWNNSVGVLGVSGPDGNYRNPPTQKKVGVFGYGIQDSQAIGVLGEAAAGLGVKGKATTGSGVYGITQSGVGVFGHSASGVGARFQTGAANVGVALQTIGRVKFDKSVGRTTIAAGTKSVVVTPGIDLTTTSAAVATLQGSANGALVERVAIDTTANTLTIYLTKNTPVAVSVAWHVFG